MEGRERINAGSYLPGRNFHFPFEFNDTDRLGPWDILLSEGTIRDLQDILFKEDVNDMHVESPLTIEKVMKKLRQISSGAWKKYGLQCEVSSLTIPIYEVELPNSDIKILWQIDYGFSIRSNSSTQHVKVWTITACQEKFITTLKTLERVHKVYNSKQIRRCKIQNLGNDNVVLPGCFGDIEKTRFADVAKNDKRLLAVHKMLVTNKFFPISRKLFKSLIMSGSDFAFQVSKKEYEIINNPTSAIVFGRSGTGKTTCIVFRQLASYLTSQFYKTPSLHDIDEDFYKRQIFITANTFLRSKIKNYFNQLHNSAMLSGKKISKADFIEWKKTYGNKSLIVNTMHEEDDENLPSVTPFRLLTDHDFPLFLTYEEFSEMLQETYGIDIRKLTTKQKQKLDTDDHNEEEYHIRPSFKNMSNASWAHYVDYNLFEAKYWPRFADNYRKKLDCELVYAEFSIIKGMNIKAECLSREEYRSISTRKYPTFCHNRDEIYDLFERYKYIKAGNSDFDAVDRTLDILRATKTKTFDGPHIHELYIDECQDNHIVDYELMFKIFDGADSIFMAGDVAQCIARGSSFRFQDLYAIMYQRNLSRIQSDNTHYNLLKPEKFELNVNYRSHNGILRLASSVIQLIEKFFPDSIDKMAPEYGEIDGPKPLIFEDYQANTLFTTDINDKKNIKKNEDTYIEFGANQVIIVRDAEAKKRVMDNISDIGLVLTVFEAKGLEFNDVLLYDFFADSPARSNWRVILSALDGYSEGIRTFSHEKHYILCSELKHLYVAVTRARMRLWIFDENSVYSEPIRRYWKCKKLAEIAKENISSLLKRSSHFEWDEVGKSFFEQQKYEQAVFCFKKSKNEKNEKLARAYLRRKEARTSFVSGSDEKTVKSKFISAAQAFVECSRLSKAASCYENIDMYCEAGICYVKSNMFESAAHCYFKAKMWNEAGVYFEKVKKYDDAVISYKNGSLYEMVTNLIQRHREEVDDETILLLNPHFRKEAEKLRSYDKFEEAANMFMRSIDVEEDRIDALQCLLHQCRVHILKKIISLTSTNMLQELHGLHSKAAEIVLKVKSKSEYWKSLTVEFQCYSSYLNKKLNKVHECIQFFRNREELVTEFFAIIMWLQVPSPSYININYWDERLQCLLRLCKLSLSFIAPQKNDDIAKISKVFEDIFFVSRVKNPYKRKVSYYNPLYYFMDIKHNENEKITNFWNVYDVDLVHQKISQFLTSYIYELISKADQDGRNNPDIASRICYNFASSNNCQNPNCRMYHIVPTPLLLFQRLKLARLQYTVVRQLDVLCRYELHKEEINNSQKWWAETLVKCHMCYQSPQTSCPEVTRMVLTKLSVHIRDDLINDVYKIWLFNESKDADNFEVMLKRTFIIQQLQDKKIIDEFYQEMSKTKILSHPSYLPVGFEYYCGNYQMIPVGRHLALFFSFLHTNKVIPAITSSGAFINYAIKNIEKVNLASSDALGELASLMEFTTSLIFAVGQEYCDFCLPRSYLINYFDVFTVNPLIPGRFIYSRKNYLSAINNSIDQVQQLLDLLFCKEEIYLPIILRLIRLLVLINLNETTFTQKILNLFKQFFSKNKIFSIKIKTYLEENRLVRLVAVLHNDLREMRCDSLVIVCYQSNSISKFAYFETYDGIKNLTYNSIGKFRFSLRKIISSATGIPVDQLI